MRSAVRRTWVAAALVALSVVVVPVPAHAQPGTTLPSGDVTGDGRSDITARTRDGRLVVYPQQANGTFGAPVTIDYGWHSVNYHTIMTARVDGTGASDVLAADTDGKLWYYQNTSTTSTPKLRVREHTADGYWGWPDGWGKPEIVDYRADGLDDVDKIYASGNETSIHHFINEGRSGLDRYESLGHDRMERGTAVWTKYSEIPGSVTRGRFRDRLIGYADGTLVVRIFYVDGTTGRHREIPIGSGFDALDSVMLKEISGDGIPDILARRTSDGALVAYVHSGQFDENNAQATYLPPRVLDWGWNTVDQLS